MISEAAVAHGSSSDPGLVSHRRRRLVSGLFYGGLGLLMLLILTATLSDVLPAAVARRVGFNSEGYTFALLLAAWIQSALPRLRGRARMPLALLAGVLCAVVALALFDGDWTSRVKTLNEAFFGLALVLPYTALRRPLPRWVPPALSAVVLVAIAYTITTDNPDSPAVLLAESFALYLLVPIAFDVVDRGILQPRAVTTAAVRWSFYLALVVVPVAVVEIGVDQRQGSGFPEVLEYVGRIHEGVIGILLVVVFFAVGLGRTGRRRRS
ncbi:MAG: hypothetical protein H0T85_05210 [Geodermatophilaceae bacterium]|nr:hypothetical protein [Geodermatophilaceae bacterium]